MKFIESITFFRGKPTKIVTIDWSDDVCVAADGAVHTRQQREQGCKLCFRAPNGWPRDHCSVYCRWDFGHTDMCQASEDARLAEAWDQ